MLFARAKPKLMALHLSELRFQANNFASFYGSFGKPTKNVQNMYFYIHNKKKGLENNENESFICSIFIPSPVLNKVNHTLLLKTLMYNLLYTKL